MLLSPFFLYTACFSTGIIVAHTAFYISLQIAFFTFITCFFYCAIKRRYTKIWPTIFSLIAFFILGYGHYRWYTHSWKYLVEKATERRHRFYGTIIEQKLTESGFFRLTIKCYLPKEFASTSIFVYVRNKDNETCFAPGTMVTVYGKLCASANTDFNEYLIKEKIIGTLFTKSQLIRTLKGKNLTAYLVRFKNHLRIVATKKMSQKTKQLFELLFLGYKEESKVTQTDLQFRAWGISHFLARSGLHLNFCIMLANTILVYIPFGWQLKQLIIFLIVVLYCLLTWTTISIVRTFLLFAIIKLFLYLKYQYDPFNVICVVWILLLLSNPFYLLFLDFQLTFILAGALMWFGKQERAH